MSFKDRCKSNEFNIAYDKRNVRPSFLSHAQWIKPKISSLRPSSPSPPPPVRVDNGVLSDQLNPSVFSFSPKFSRRPKRDSKITRTEAGVARHTRAGTTRRTRFPGAVAINRIDRVAFRDTIRRFHPRTRSVRLGHTFLIIHSRRQRRRTSCSPLEYRGNACSRIRHSFGMHETSAHL